MPDLLNREQRERIVHGRRMVELSGLSKNAAVHDFATELSWALDTIDRLEGENAECLAENDRLYNTLADYEERQP